MSTSEAEALHRWVVVVGVPAVTHKPAPGWVVAPIAAEDRDALPVGSHVVMVPDRARATLYLLPLDAPAGADERTVYALAVWALRRNPPACWEGGTPDGDRVD